MKSKTKYNLEKWQNSTVIWFGKRTQRASAMKMPQENKHKEMKGQLGQSCPKRRDNENPCAGAAGELKEEIACLSPSKRYSESNVCLVVEPNVYRATDGNEVKSWRVEEIHKEEGQGKRER